MKSVLPLTYITTFLFLFGESLQPAPRIQIYESIICRNYYRNAPSSHDADPGRCKISPVQQELALLIGVERLSIILPSILAIPFGALADYLGHGLILSIALFGVFLEESWPFLVCWVPDVFSIRLIWLHFLFSIIGGGMTVIITLVHVIIASVVDADLRTKTFLQVRAAGVFASILGYTMAGVMMKKNVWLPWAIGNVSILLAAVVAMLIPKTSLTQSDSSEENDASISWRDSVISARALLESTLKVIAGNKRVLIVLVSTLLCQLGYNSVPLMMVIYVSKRYGWSFADANMLSSLQMAVEFTSLLVLLPLITSIFARQGFSTFHRNKYTAQACIAILAIGTVCLAIAPVVGLAILGLILVASGSGQESLVRSIATDLVDVSEISVVYSAITIMRNIGDSVAGPIYAGLYAGGLGMGGTWLGLPFIFASGLFVVVCLLFVALRDNSGYEVVPDDDRERVAASI